MHWVLSDVRDIHGDAGLRGRGDAWEDPGIPVIYPHLNPDGKAQPVSPEMELDSVLDEELLPEPMPRSQPSRNLPPLPTPQPRQRTVPPDPIPPGQARPGLVPPEPMPPGQVPQPVPPGSVPPGPLPQQGAEAGGAGRSPAASASQSGGSAAPGNADGNSSLKLMPATGAYVQPHGHHVQPAVWAEPAMHGPAQPGMPQPAGAAPHPWPQPASPPGQPVRLISPAERAHYAPPQPVGPVHPGQPQPHWHRQGTAPQRHNG